MYKMVNDLPFRACKDNKYIFFNFQFKMYKMVNDLLVESLQKQSFSSALFHFKASHPNINLIDFENLFLLLLLHPLPFPFIGLLHGGDVRQDPVVQKVAWRKVFSRNRLKPFWLGLFMCGWKLLERGPKQTENNKQMMMVYSTFWSQITG